LLSFIGNPDRTAPIKGQPKVNKKALQFIRLAGMALAGITLLEVTPAPGRRVGTLEAPIPPASSALDEASIRALHQRKVDGWNHRSAEDFAAAFADDADLVTFGIHLKGRQEIASFYRQLFDALLNGSRLEGRIKSVRFFNADVAVMHAISSTMTRGEAEISPDREAVETLVLTRSDSQWRIATLQDSRPAFELQTVLKPGSRLSRAQH
jgi:uncharacterized protein (TIGR02246 family)